MMKPTSWITPLTFTLLAGSAFAQVPQGWGVYSRLFYRAGGSTPAGITMFAPFHGTSRCTTARPFVALTNLPAELSIQTGSAFGGTNCVLIRERDGSVIASNVTQVAGVVAIWHLTLSGTRVVRARKYDLGKSARAAEVAQMAWLPNGNVLFTHRGLSGPTGSPLPTQGLATLDLTSGAVRSIPLKSWPGGTINAAAIDRSGRTIYFGNFNLSPRTFQVWSVPVTGGSPKQVGPNLTDGPYQLATDHRDTVWVSCWNQGLFYYDARSNRWTNVNKTRQLNAMTIEPVSGEHVQMSAPITTPTIMQRWTQVNGLKAVPNVPAKDLVSGMAIRSSMLAYGKQGGGAAAYTWQTSPNPGGAPLVGNQKFSLTLKTSSNPSWSFIAYATRAARQPIPIFGRATLLLDPSTVFLTLPMQRTNGVISTPLPIPVQNSLCGVDVYTQSFHVEGPALVSSPAMTVRLL